MNYSLKDGMTIVCGCGAMFGSQVNGQLVVGYQTFSRPVSFTCNLCGTQLTWKRDFLSKYAPEAESSKKKLIQIKMKKALDADLILCESAAEFPC